MNPNSQLRRAVGRSGFFTLAFGGMVGSAWIVLLGDWLRAAGPAGAALGIITGAVAMILIALCYGELAVRFPAAGGEFLYTLQTYGRLPAFVMAWFLVLYTVSTCAFEAIACAWLLRELLPALDFGTAYVIAGEPVNWAALLIGAVGSIVIGVIHYCGSQSAIRFQNFITFSFLGICLLLNCLALARGSVTNLHPLFSSESYPSWVLGSLWLFSTAAFFLNGWQTALHALEERRESVTPRAAVLSMIASIVVAAFFYIALILAAGSSQPWTRSIAAQVPAAAAFRAVGFHGVLGTVLLIAASASLLKSWSGMVWIASRLMFALAREGMLPRPFSTVHTTSGAPRVAILCVTGLTLVGLSFGRSFIVPMVNMVTTCLALTLVVCMFVLLRQRRLHHVETAFSVPGGTTTIAVAIVSAITMILIALAEPFLKGRRGIPIEWVLLVVWGILGGLIWKLTERLRLHAVTRPV
jgi:basic amino acid/polyamine antiporter, APA family